MAANAKPRLPINRAAKTGARHPLCHKHPKAPASTPAIVWPTFTGTAQPVGTSPSGLVTVYVDPAAGAEAAQNAQDLLKGADDIVNMNVSIFGTPAEPVNVLLYALSGATDGTGGADHGACNFVNGGNIEVDVSFGSSQRCLALFMAELSECAMNGQLCGLSTGEALSRWCSIKAAPGALNDFATAPVWAADGMPDYVDFTDPTDQNPDSIGCGMAFLSWLQSLGYALPQIAQRMVELGDGGTLAQLYAVLAADLSENAWPLFTQALAALPAAISNDDPWAVVLPRPAAS